jgi:hypothetical protein
LSKKAELVIEMISCEEAAEDKYCHLVEGKFFVLMG